MTENHLPKHQFCGSLFVLDKSVFFFVTFLDPQVVPPTLVGQIEELGVPWAVFAYAVRLPKVKEERMRRQLDLPSQAVGRCIFLSKQPLSRGYVNFQGCTLSQDKTNLKNHPMRTEQTF